MKKIPFLLLLLLVLATEHVYAQVPAVISAPISEKISRKQIGHQGVSASLRATGKSLAASVKAVSGAIKTVSDQTKNLHQAWYTSLLNISPGVRNYRRVGEIYTAQQGMIRHFSSAVTDLRQRGLTPAQITEVSAFYQAMLQENIGLIGELTTVLATNRAQMTDPQRLKFIDRIADRVHAQQNLMQYYTNKCQAAAFKQQVETQDRATLLAFMGGR